MSLVVRKPAFCICENKVADQLRGNHEADQRLCFRYTDSTTPLLPKYEISSLQPSFVAVQTGLCQTWSETPKTGFLITRLTCTFSSEVCAYMVNIVVYFFKFENTYLYNPQRNSCNVGAVWGEGPGALPARLH